VRESIEREKERESGGKNKEREELRTCAAARRSDITTRLFSRNF